ncbi:MAG: hypothetical protein EZS28_006005 [Streblomastix strix]|uniref:Uncharacterized protein n=1 Tax=Streblomastix strix TaxID=222440 RepID=A0A5J4WTT5_9EUKA|nr:MAG: hypothetical protein EZS28_006005 [Streblomastix strix]
MNISDVQDVADKFWQGRQLQQQKELFLQKRVPFWNQLKYATNGTVEFGRIALKLKNCPTSDASCERNFSELRRKLGRLRGNLETIKLLRELQILEIAKQKSEQRKQNGYRHNMIDITSESVVQSRKAKMQNQHPVFQQKKLKIVNKLKILLSNNPLPENHMLESTKYQMSLKLYQTLKPSQLQLMKVKQHRCLQVNLPQIEILRMDNQRIHKADQIVKGNQVK